MVDVVVASDNVVVVGGPSSIDVSLDIGPEGQRGSQIYTDLGKPTDVYLPDVQVNDLYINLKQSDSEYLYLYKYSSFNGVFGWSKVLRLVPNTVLSNPIVRFINGEAHTLIVADGIPLAIKGLYFPLSALFPDGTLSISINDLNVQHSVMSDSVVSSGLKLDSIGSSFTVQVYDQATQSHLVQVRDLNGQYIRAFLNASEGSVGITGFREVDFLVTIGGRDPSAGYFDSATIENDAININSHGLPDGTPVYYLNNGNTSISGLVNESLYLTSLVDSNNIKLRDATTGEIVNVSATAATETHIVLRLMEV